MSNGETRPGFVNTKSLKKKKTVVYKPSDDAAKEKIPLASIDKIIFNIQGQLHELDNVAFAYAEGYKIKYAWMFKLEEGYYDLYTQAHYGFTKEGDIVFSVEYIRNGTLPSIPFFIKKFDEEVAYSFALYSNSPTYFGLHNVLRKNVKKYMADYPDLVEKVDEKDLSTSDVEQIVREYNQFKL